MLVKEFILPAVVKLVPTLRALQKVFIRDLEEERIPLLWRNSSYLSGSTSITEGDTKGLVVGLRDELFDERWSTPKWSRKLFSLFKVTTKQENDVIDDKKKQNIL